MANRFVFGDDGNIARAGQYPERKYETDGGAFNVSPCRNRTWNEIVPVSNRSLPSQIGSLVNIYMKN